MPFMRARLGAAALLLMALGRNSYDFYTIMRWMVCGVCSYGAVLEFGRDRSIWAWPFWARRSESRPFAARKVGHLRV